MKIVTLLLLTLLFAGCTVRTNLAYEPICPEKKSRSIAVYVESLRDERKGSHIATVRDPQGNPLVYVEGNENMQEWITNSLKIELARSGFTLVDSSDNYEFVIHGKIKKARYDNLAYFSDGLKLELTLSDRSEELFRRRYSMNEPVEMIPIGAKKLVARKMETHLQEILLSAIDDLGEKMIQNHSRLHSLKRFHQ